MYLQEEKLIDSAGLKALLSLNDWVWPAEEAFTQASSFPKCIRKSDVYSSA